MDLTFFRKSEVDWPKPKPQPIPSEDPEVKGDLMANIIIANSEGATTKLRNYFSDWAKLKTSVAWFLRFKEIFLELSRKRKEMIASADSAIQPERVEEEVRRARDAIGKQPLSVCDLSRAESAIICFSQQETYMEEICSLKGGKSSVKKTSDIYRLDPVL